VYLSVTEQVRHKSLYRQNKYEVISQRRPKCMRTSVVACFLARAFNSLYRTVDDDLFVAALVVVGL